MKVERIDHIVLTVQDIHRTAEFYAAVLGMEVVSFGDGRKALEFGPEVARQRIHLHQAGREIAPHAHRPGVGTADFCLITGQPLPEVLKHLHAYKVEVVEGIVRREGAMGHLESIYVRDPDGNLIEIADLPNRTDWGIG